MLKYWPITTWPAESQIDRFMVDVDSAAGAVVLVGSGVLVEKGVPVGTISVDRWTVGVTVEARITDGLETIVGLSRIVAG